MGTLQTNSDPFSRGVKKHRWLWDDNQPRRTLHGSELGHGLGALGHGVLGELAGEDEAHGGLDLARGQRRLLVVAGQTAGLGGNALEDVVDEGVHDGHSLLGDTSIRMDLLEDLVDVGRVRFGTLGSLLSAGAGLLRCLGRLLARSLGHVGNLL